MKNYRTIVALGILLLSSAAQASHYSPPHSPPSSCKGPIAQLFWLFGDKDECGPTVSVPEPATLGLLGIGLLGLAIKRRRK
jgi:hypothetical protein